jgi:hypothetical protein
MKKDAKLNAVFKRRACCLCFDLGDSLPKPFCFENEASASLPKTRSCSCAWAWASREARQYEEGGSHPTQ